MIAPYPRKSKSYNFNAHVFDDHDRDFNMAKKTIRFAMIIQFIIIITIFTVIIGGIIFIFSNPETIGEFFGRISSGFNSIK